MLQLGLQGSITLDGVVSEKKKWQGYASAGLCVFPSHVEGWGIVPIEAHLAGLPVVAYDLPAYASTIRQSPAAKLVSIGDTGAFATATIEWIRTPPSTSEVRKFAEEFSWDVALRIEESAIARFVNQSTRK
jgi:glycosyltransferase involved in cell wall biosynthesis